MEVMTVLFKLMEVMTVLFKSMEVMTALFKLMEVMTLLFKLKLIKLPDIGVCHYSLILIFIMCCGYKFSNGELVLWIMIFNKTLPEFTFILIDWHLTLTLAVFQKLALNTNQSIQVNKITVFMKKCSYNFSSNKFITKIKPFVKISTVIVWFKLNY